MRRTIILIVAGLLASGWSVAYAQIEDESRISSVAVNGLAKTTDGYARDLIRVRAGDRLDRTELDEAVARLLRSGRYLTATYSVDEGDAGYDITFDVREHSIVTAILFEGNTHFSAGQLQKEVLQKTGGAADWLAIRSGRDAIIAMYREAGYGDATVTYDQRRMETTGELVFTIDEGKRIRIREIRFEGNTALTDRQLKKHVDTKTAFWIFRAGALDTDRAEADTARVQRFYRDEGFLDAKVAYRVEVEKGGADQSVIFSIEEGSRYAIERIDFTGNTVFTDDELLAMIESRAGETAHRPAIDRDTRAIHKRYGELGHIYATVRAVRVFSDTPGLVRLTFEINEGEQIRIGRVVVRGNSRTRDKVVRRALGLYPPDDLFDLTEANEAEKRLLESRIFSSARVYPVGDRPGVRDAIIDVKEADKAGDFIFGLGVTSNSGIVGNIVLDLQNFDLSDRPKSWSELIKLRSFVGGGQRFRLELQPGTNVSRFRIDFTEPYLYDKPLRFDFSGFLFERGRDGYDERRVGSTISIGKRFERGRLRGWSGELAMRIEDANVRDVDLFAAKEIREDRGSNLITSIKGSLARDRTDNRFVPSTGDRFNIGYEQTGVLGGDHSFGKLTLGYTWYRTLHTDLLDRKHILKLHADGGLIVGDVPVFERFFAGGTGSVRGFDFRGIGERGGLDKNNIGGDYLVLLGAEYSYPLIGENIRGMVFLDTGTAGSGAYRAAIGTGVRFTINLFGPVPLEFNLALPISSGPDDEEQVFSFLIGRIF